MKSNKIIYIITALVSAILVGCSSQSVSIVGENHEIINIEERLNDLVKVATFPHSVKVTNQTDNPVSIQYQVFWYDYRGVTQLANYNNNGIALSPWSHAVLQPGASESIELVKPTARSEIYRVYLR